jgi:cytochrome P450
MTKHKLPSGPTMPKWLQMAKFMRKPIEYFDECRAKYGTTFTLRLPGQPPYVVVCDPADIKKLFINSSTKQLHTGEINGSVFKPVLGSFSLLTLDGEKHLQHRKLMLPPFHGERMQMYGEIMAKMADKQMQHWRAGNKVNLFNEMRDVTFNIILSAVFGMDEDNIRFKPLETALRKLLATIKSTFGLITLLFKPLQIHLGPLTPWTKIIKLRKQVDEILFAEIAARRQTNLTDRVDILSMLLQAKDENDVPMPNQEIRDEMLTLLIAGHETTATAIAWSFYRILSDRNVLEKIHTEINTFAINDAELINNVNKLTYVDAAIKETFRMMPVIPYMARLTKTDYEVNQYTVPTDVAIIPCAYLAHNEISYWSEPQKYNPDRFVNSTETPYTFLPFGGGMRRCIGAAFAQYEMKIVLAKVLREINLTLPKNYQPKLVRKGIVIAPHDGVTVTIN